MRRRVGCELGDASDAPVAVPQLVRARPDGAHRVEQEARRTEPGPPLRERGYTDERE